MARKIIIWILNNLLAFVLGILVGVFTLSLAGSFFLKGTNSLADWLSGFLQNSSTEIFGALMSFVLFNLILGVREKAKEKAQAEEKEKRTKQEAEESEKQRLLVDLSSRDHATVAKALGLILLKGWDLGELLRITKPNLRNANWAKAQLEGMDLSRVDFTGIDLRYSNLRNTKLTKAIFQSSILHDANLENAKLYGADLERATLANASLKRAILCKANLQGVAMGNANLEDANLVCTKLQGADFRNANLLRANLEKATFDNHTALPPAKNRETDKEGKIFSECDWRPDTNMCRYTDPDYKDENGKPDFWQPA